jgi:putative kinase
MGRFVSFRISESGMDAAVRFTQKTVDRVFRPIVDEIAAEFASRAAGPSGKDRYCGGRYILGVSGPPGSGKSTVSSVLNLLFAERGVPAVVLPLDGFHLRNDELKARTIKAGGKILSLYDRKGSKESYDFEKLIAYMEKLKYPAAFFWPLYSRVLHEPVEEGELLDRGPRVCIVEGNYLFLRAAPWPLLGPFFHKTLFIRSRKTVMRRRIIARKMRGGFTRSEAERHFRRSDALNIREVIRCSGGYGMLLSTRGRHGYRLVRL